MYKVNVRRHFDAAHALRGYNGQCENLHGHRWQIVVCVSSEELDETGLAFDFTVLKGELDAILDGFDHQYLNEVAPFDRINPSSENIARTIFEALENRIPEICIEYVESWESPDAWATYSKR